MYCIYCKQVYRNSAWWRPYCLYLKMSMTGHVFFISTRYLRRGARLLKLQTSITVYHLPIKENKLPFSVYIYIETAAYKYVYICIYTSLYIIYMYNVSLYILYICCRFKRKTEAKAIFLNPFTVCSSLRYLIRLTVFDPFYYLVYFTLRCADFYVSLFDRLTI
jgi:hypothetical protein